MLVQVLKRTVVCPVGLDLCNFSRTSPLALLKVKFYSGKLLHVIEVLVGAAALQCHLVFLCRMTIF